MNRAELQNVATEAGSLLLRSGAEIYRVEELSLIHICFFPSNLFPRIFRATSGRRTILIILPMSRAFSRICCVR